MAPQAPYSEQERGDRSAYERYLAGMDASMKQKVALTAAHLLSQGRVADMGMGSGAGSHALAALYPGLQVVGVDVNPTMVELARERFKLPNLSFVAGDVAQPVFPADSLDGIFDSSVLHHVTTFGGYRHQNAAEALEVQARALKPHGVLVVRDFLDPGPGEVLLDLPANDGDDSDNPRTCSTARLFERFAREFRSLSPKPGFSYQRENSAPEGWARFRVARTLATEFALRKDYRSDWESEVKEEYTYCTRDDFEATFARLGLRVLSSTPLWNPWIVRHRFNGKLALRDLAGAPLEPPATNYLIAGERVPDGEGVRFREAAVAPPLGFLELEHYRHRGTGQVRDLVRRPNRTLDVLPYFESSGELFVLARMSYPRPILSANPRGSTRIDQSRAAHYVTEPLNVPQTDRPLGQTVERALSTHAALGPERIRGFRSGATYFPSPGGVQEEVRSTFVEVDPVFVRERIGNLSGFSTSGRVRAIEAHQLLRSGQVGGLADARLELNVYQLLTALGRGWGAWIGEALALGSGPPPSRVRTMDELTARPARRVFEAVPRLGSSRFLELCCAQFEELDAAGRVVASRPLEFVVPGPLSTNTLSVAVLRRSGDQVFMGLDDDDLPAAQCFNGNSELLVTPAWRLPRVCASRTQAQDWMRGRLAAEHGVVAGELWELGGPYHPSPGVTAEVVYPVAVELSSEGPAPHPLHWVALREVISHLDAVLDGHARIAALRAAHALGL